MPDIDNIFLLVMLTLIGAGCGFGYASHVGEQTRQPVLDTPQGTKYILLGAFLGFLVWPATIGLIHLFVLLPIMTQRWFKVMLIVIGPLCLGGFIGESLKDPEYKHINWAGFGIGAALATTIPILCYFAGTFYWILHPLE